MENEVPQTKEPRKDAVGITIVIAVAVIALACIASCTGVMIAFLMNPPW